MSKKERAINNSFYDELGSDWDEGICHPIALLRAENRVRNPWIGDQIKAHFKTPVACLDIGCGGGLLTSYLSSLGHKVTGIDQSKPSLEVARKKDSSTQSAYIEADALNLPFKDRSFEVVSAMDLLEHVSDYQKVLKEAARVLKPGGLFFFHTFNRTPLSYFLVIKGVEWFVPNSPKDMHVYPLFIKPKELEDVLKTQGCSVLNLHGLTPKIGTKSFWRLVLKRKLEDDFEFKFSKNLNTGYVGVARKTR